MGILVTIEIFPKKVRNDLTQALWMCRRRVNTWISSFPLTIERERRSLISFKVSSRKAVKGQPRSLNLQNDQRWTWAGAPSATGPHGVCDPTRRELHPPGRNMALRGTLVSGPVPILPGHRPHIHQSKNRQSALDRLPGRRFGWMLCGLLPYSVLHPVPLRCGARVPQLPEESRQIQPSVTSHIRQNKNICWFRVRNVTKKDRVGQSAFFSFLFFFFFLKLSRF